METETKENQLDYELNIIHVNRNRTINFGRKTEKDIEENMTFISRQTCENCNKHYQIFDKIDFVHTEQGFIWWHLPRNTKSKSELHCTHIQY